ncbi:MAG: DciA family protein [Leptolyngbyaceae cyanobacterium MO_188.B28]|nr:DciA family protein [Leptolyngbyaceae cyanobacterium MO_188.B28]
MSRKKGVRLIRHLFEGRLATFYEYVQTLRLKINRPMSLQPLNHVLTNIEKQENWRSRRQFRRIVEIWPKAVGYAVARQTRPVGIHRHILQVAAASSAWAQTLTFERRQILEKLNAHASIALTDIRFSTAQWRKSPHSQTNLSELEQNRLWRDHPSWTHGQGSALKSAPPSGAENQNPMEAFQQWANRVQTRALNHPVCPSCRCSCPPGELKRWSVCAICAAKRW